MARLFIVEQSALAPGGHYYAYTRSVARAARDAGLDVTLLENRRFKGDWDVPGAEIIPAFTHTWGEAEKLWIRDWVPGNLAFEMHQAFRIRRPQAGDHVFLATMGFAELRTILDYLIALPVGRDYPFFHLLLRYDAQDHSGILAEYRLLFDRVRKSALLSRIVLFHSDTEPLSVDYARMTGLPFTTLPIPFNQEPLKARLAERGPAEAPLVITYLGDARLEKNFADIPDAVAFLWENYVKTGRVRFALQANFNVEGGEPGVLTAVQRLGQYAPSFVELIDTPLDSDAYYRRLADADIVMVPYDPERYRARSSGILVEAMAAGKPVATTADSWMETQVTAEHAVLYEGGEGLGPALKRIIDDYPRYASAAASIAPEVMKWSSADNFIRALREDASARAGLPRPQGPRILFIIDGDPVVVRNGAGFVARTQLRYLAEAGYTVCALFLMNKRDKSVEEIEAWTEQLRERVAEFDLEGVFLAGTGRLSLDTLRQRAVRHAYEFSIAADLEQVQGFEVSAELIAYLRAHPIDAILLNYVTNVPLLDNLGLGDVPILCETHDIQAFQKAIYGRKRVEPRDLEEEFQLLARCRHLISLNEAETVYLREHLPNAAITTTGIFAEIAPPAARSLAGPKNLGEVISSCGPSLVEYQWEGAWAAHTPEEVLRLAELQSLDLVYVSSNHLSNVSGLKWFLAEVFLPILAPAGASMVVAGSIKDAAEWPEHKRLFFVGRLAELDPLYAAARVIVLPILEGAGAAVKAAEALATGRPVVSTPFALRGLPGDIEGVDIAQTPREFASAVLRLLRSPDLRSERAEAVLQAARRLADPAHYAELMNAAFQDILGERALPVRRQASEPAPQPSVREWTRTLERANRLIRNWLDNEAFEDSALIGLSKRPQSEVADTLNAVIEALLIDKTAPFLDTNPRVRGQTTLLEPGGAETLARVILIGRRTHLPEEDLDGADVLDFVGEPELALTLAAIGRELPLELELEWAGEARLASLATTGSVAWAELPARDTGSAYPSFGRLPGAGADGAYVLSQTIPLDGSLMHLGRPLLFSGESAGSAMLAPDATFSLRLPALFSPVQSTRWLDLAFEGDDLEVDVTINGQPAPERRFQHHGLTILRFALPRTPARTRAQLFTLEAAISVVAGEGALVEARNLLVFGADPELLLERFDALGGPVETAAAPSDEARREAEQQAVENLLQTTTHGLPARRERVGALRRRLQANPNGLNAALESLLDDLGAERSGSGGGLLEDVLCVLAPEAALDGQGSAFVASWGLTVAIEARFSDAGAAAGAECRVDGEALTPFPAASPTDRAWRRMGRDSGRWLNRVELSSGGALTPSSVHLVVRLPATQDIATGHRYVKIDGEHKPEMLSAELGQLWTGPSPRMTMSIPIALTRQCEVILDVSSFARCESADDVLLSLNGRSLSPRLERNGQGGGRVTATYTPGADGGPAVAQLEVHTRKMFDPPGDPRRLGIALNAVELRFPL